MISIVIFLLLQTINTRAEERLQAFFKTEHNSVLFDETPISEKRSDSLISCSHRCTRDKRCKSANFIKSDKTCSLLDKTRATHPGHFLKQANVIHLEKVFIYEHMYNWMALYTRDTQHSIRISLKFVVRFGSEIAKQEQIIPLS